MSTESDKNLKENKSKPLIKPNLEPIKPNLRNRGVTVNSYKSLPIKKIVSKPISNCKDKTPIKSKINEEIMKKNPILSEFHEDESDKKQMTDTRKEKVNFLIRDESPWTKFCKSDLSPLCKNNLISPNKQNNPEIDPFSQAKMTNRLIEYQTPSPSLLKKGEFLDFSPFLNYTAKKVIQKLDFSNLDDKKGKNSQTNAKNSVIVCFKSPTFNFLNKKYELEEDFIFSNHPKASIDKLDNSSSDQGEDDIIKLISKGPNAKENPQVNDVKQKQESYLKTMNKYKDVDLESNIQTTKKITPFTTTNESKNLQEELNPKNLNIHSFYSTPKGSLNHNIASSKLNFKSPNVDNEQKYMTNIEFATNNTKTAEKKNEGLEENQENQDSFQLPKKILCNCKKSRCLKLYCDCFAAGEYCSKECNCMNCANILENEDERYSSMMTLMERNPLAFKPKYDKKEEIDEKSIINNDFNDKIRHAKGCNCKKSNCLKKYCECYQAGIKCTDLCKCDTCKNNEGNEPMKKRKCNHYMDNFNQLPDVKQESGLQQTNSFTFGYNVIYDNAKDKMENLDEEESFASNQSFSANINGKNIKNSGMMGTYYQTPKAKLENMSIKKEKIK